MTPDKLVTVILGILGVALQLAFQYGGKFADWYQSHPQKGLLALTFSIVIGAVYFGFSCTPYVADLKIALTCDRAGVFTLLQAIFIIATSQQVSYLVLRKNS
jgi:hypothetical protein